MGRYEFSHGFTKCLNSIVRLSTTFVAADAGRWNLSGFLGKDREKQDRGLDDRGRRQIYAINRADNEA